jgi:hypothetical protein
MPLHPFREALGRAGMRAFEHDSSFKPEADAALARFHAMRDELERQVRRGDMTVKVARDRAREAAVELKITLARKAEGYSPVPRAFLERLVEASDARRRAQEAMPLEGLQRETNRLLRKTLIEQQLMTRAGEFEGRTFVRALPGGKLAPTLDSLLAFHDAASHAGDDAATEWSRRQLEAIRARVAEPDDLRRIDQACDCPDVVNPRIVARYMEVLEDRDLETLETFVKEALEGRDANACVAAFLMARAAPNDPLARWVRTVLNGVASFPDAALSALRAIEAEARNEDAENAQAQVEYAVAVAEAQVRLAGLEAPTEDDLARQARVKARPVAALGEPIGLALDCRGAYPDDPTEPAAPVMLPDE